MGGRSLRDILVAVITYNEGERLRQLVRLFPTPTEYRLIFVDDGSTDQSAEWLTGAGYHVIRNEKNCGVGASIRTAIDYGRRHGLQAIVVMAGNGKMMPDEIPRLVAPIIEDRADYVQGSRYLEGGQRPNLPLFRNLAIRLFTSVTNMLLRYRGTDVTCGFRAYRLDILDHPDINLDQEWLDRYELEYYIHYKVARDDFRMVEVPVTMAYPEEKKNYSKIRPLVGWWSMLRPWVFLFFRLRR